MRWDRFGAAWAVPSSRFILAGSLLLLSAACATIDREQVQRRSDHIFRPTGALAEGPPLDAGPSVIDENTTIDELVALALAHNPELYAAFERWRSALERIPQAGALPEPQVMWTHFIEEVQTRTGPQENRIILSQGLPWIGKLTARSRIASREAESLWWKVEAKRAALIREVKEAFHEYAYLAEAVRTTGENLELLQQLEPIVQQKIVAGGSHQDLLRLQVEIGKLENELASLEDYRPALSARLTTALNLESGDVLPWPERSEPDGVALERGPLLDRLRENNPDLRELRWKIEKVRSQIRLARSGRFPDFNVGVLYIDTGEAQSPMPPMMPPPDSGEDPYAVTLGMTIPIWGQKYSAAEREARHTLAASEADYEARGDRLVSDLELALYRLADAERQLPLYRDSLIPRARESLEITRVDYQSGGASLLDVIDSQRRLLAFELALRRAASQYAQRLATIEALIGEELR